MGMNESIHSKRKYRGQQQTANLGKYHLDVYKFNSPQQQPVPAKNVGSNEVGNRVDGKWSFNASTPMAQPPMSSQLTTSASTLGELRKASGSGAVMSRVGVAQGGPGRMKPEGTGSVIYPKPVPQAFRSKKVVSRPLHDAPSSKPFAVAVVTQNASGLYKKHYPRYVNKAQYNIPKNTRAQPIVYFEGNGYSKDSKLLNAWKTSRYQEPGSFVTPPQQSTFFPVDGQNTRNSIVFKENSMVGVVQMLHPSEETRKLALRNLLIRPIIIMKGEAWDEIGWKDFNAPHSFHSACADFLKIIELTKDKKIALEIKDFLGSDLLTPRYIAENQPPGKKLNHFHVFWNMMHQLPFSVKRWDKKTREKLKLFYQVWVTFTIQCGYCRGHYQEWIQKHPPVVNDRESLSQWLFKLHNDVNRRTSKPQFHWGKYNQRWGPSDLQLQNKRMVGNRRNSTPPKSISTVDSTPQTYTSRTWTSSNLGRRGREVDEDFPTLKTYQPREQKRPMLIPKIGLPRRCLPERQLYLRRSRVNKRNGPLLPRNRVSRSEGNLIRVK